MKKLILLFLLFYSFAYSQVDTANYNFQMSQLDGKFYSLISKNEVFGSAGFRYQTKILQTSSIDTTQFQYVPELSFGYYSMIENIATYYGKDSGTVRMILSDSPLITNETFSDSTTFLGAIWQLGNVTDRPVIYQKYSDGSTPLQSFVGQVGVSEANWGMNLDYRLGVHNYWDSTKPIDYLTINVDGVTWQHIPKGYANVTALPDSWANSGNTTPWKVDTSGFMGIIGGLTSIFKTRGNPTIGTSTANDYTDTTKYNFYGRGGKNYMQNKLGIGTETPYSRLHLIGDAGSVGGSYNANADIIIDDNGTSALLQLINPTSSYITMGNSSTYNLGYIGYTNSTGVLSLFGTTSVNANILSEGGTLLSSKYAILGNTNTFVNDQIFSGRVRTDTVLNVLGALTINDTATVTGRLNVAQDLSIGNDGIIANARFMILGFNSSGTIGVALNSTADNTLRIRNAGVSTDATVQIGSLITSTVTPIATASTAGTQGQIRIGSDGYIYICTATNTWVRVQAVTW